MNIRRIAPVVPLAALLLAVGTAQAAYEGSRQSRMDEAYQNYRASTGADTRAGVSDRSRDTVGTTGSPGERLRASGRQFKEDAKSAGHQVVDGSKKAGRAIAGGARKAGHAVRDEARKLKND